MPQIDRYILSQFLTLFGFFALVLVSVYWINCAVSLFEQLISDGQTALVVLEFTALMLPLVISIVLPIAAFTASAYGTNRLSSESEPAILCAARPAGGNGSGLWGAGGGDGGAAGAFLRADGAGAPCRPPGRDRPERHRAIPARG